MLHFFKNQGSPNSPHISVAIFLERGPDILKTEMPALPGAVAGAIIVLLIVKSVLGSFS